MNENSHFCDDNNYRRSGEVGAMRIPEDADSDTSSLWGSLNTVGIEYTLRQPATRFELNLKLGSTEPESMLRIDLTAPTLDVGEPHRLIELNGGVDQADRKSGRGEPTLSIVEAESYARAREK